MKRHSLGKFIFINSVSGTTKGYEEIGMNLCQALTIYMPIKRINEKLLEIIEEITPFVLERCTELQIPECMNKSITIPEMSIKEKIRNQHMQIFSSKKIMRKKEYMTDSLSYILDLDINEIIEKVKDQNPNQTNSEIIDDDISSSDSEQERNKIITKRKKKAKKKRKIKLTNLFLEESKPKTPNMFYCRQNHIAKLPTRNNLPKKRITIEAKDSTPSCISSSFHKVPEHKTCKASDERIYFLKRRTSTEKTSNIIELSLQGKQIKNLSGAKHSFNPRLLATSKILEKPGWDNKWQSKKKYEMKYTAGIVGKFDKGIFETADYQKMFIKPQVGVSEFSNRGLFRYYDRCSIENTTDYGCCDSFMKRRFSNNHDLRKNKTKNPRNKETISYGCNKLIY